MPNVIGGEVVAGLKSFYAYCTRPGIPRADPGRFTILVADLEDDDRKEHKRLIIEEFNGFKGIKVLSLDKPIPLTGSDPEGMERQGHAKAQEYLRKSGAQVIIWGAILRRHDQNFPKLYWTLSQTAEMRGRIYNPSNEQESYRLPVLVWEDLAETLRLLIFTCMSEFEGKKGQYVADQLEPFINQVRTLLNQSSNRPGWNATARADVARILANALMKLGEQKGEKKYLSEALGFFEQALQTYTREKDLL